jgi:predicted nucleic acid-binding protein
VTIIADTGALYALYDADDLHHTAVREVLERERGPIVVPVRAAERPQDSNG